MFGYLFAIISSLFFTFYVIPRKLSKLSPAIFSFFMAIGFFVSTVVLYLFQPILKFHETPNLSLIWSVFAGAIWAISFVLYVLSIDAIGLSRSNQWKNLQGPIAVFVGLIVLGEYTTTNPLFAVLAAIAIFLSATFLTNTSGNKIGHIEKKGVYLAVLSAVGFGIVADIQKYVVSHVGIYTQQVVWSLSIALSLFIYILFKNRLKEIVRNSRKEVFIALVAGVLYLGAAFFQLLSFKFIALSIAFTIVQMNALWTIAIGILLFKEISLRKFYKHVGLGLLLTIIGIALLVFARK